MLSDSRDSYWREKWMGIAAFLSMKMTKRCHKICSPVTYCLRCDVMVDAAQSSFCRLAQVRGLGRFPKDESILLFVLFTTSKIIVM